MGASLKAVIIAGLAAVMMGGLALFSPATPVYGVASPPATDNTVGTDATGGTDGTPQEGTVEVLVRGPGKVNGCGPDIDGSQTETLCEFFGNVGSQLTLTPVRQTDNAHTVGIFDRWIGCTPDANDRCRVNVPDGVRQGLTVEFHDTHAAALTVTSPSDNQLVISPNGAVSIAWNADETVTGATCKVDNGTARACNPNDGATVTTGDPTTHTLEVTAKDNWAAGGRGTTSSVTRNWREYITQATTITGGPAEGSAINTPATRFDFTTNKHPAGTTFTCTLDLITDAGCVSGRNWPGLGEGAHTFSVKSIVDVGSGQTATSATVTRHFTVDLTPPDTTIADGPADGLLTNLRSAALTLTSSEPGSTFECSLNGAAFAACPGGASALFDDVGIGQASVAARAVDRAGNADPLPATRTWTVTADLDGDGFTLPGDCDDSNPAIHPGATEILDNGIDENCNGVPELNLDRDGDRFPRPQDCNDANRKIHPGAREIAGNKVDENCDRIVAPFPTLPSSVGYAWVPRGTATLLKSFYVRNAPAGSMIRVACRGRCAVSSRTHRVKKATHIVDLTRLVKGRMLAPGTVLEVSVTKPRTIGSFTTLKMRAKGGPVKQERCLRPGARSPKRC